MIDTPAMGNHYTEMMKTIDLLTKEFDGTDTQGMCMEILDTITDHRLMTFFCMEIGMSEKSVYDQRKKNRRLRLDTMENFLRVLGYRFKVVKIDDEE